MNIYNLAILCFGFCSLLLGLLIWLKRQDIVGKRYLGVSLCYAGWAIFISINLNNDISPELGLFMGRLGNGFAVFIPPFWYHFICAYTGSIERRRIFIKFLYFAASIIGCFTFSPWFISEVIPRVGFKYYSQAGIIFYFSTLIFATVIPLSFYELYHKIKTTQGHEKRQLQSLFWISAVGYLGGCPTFFPIFGIPLPQYTLLLLPLYPFGLTYIMIKQKLFDVEELAQAAHRDKLVAIGVLAASINHEVRNPLFVIRGLAESWLDRKKEGVFKDDKQIVEKGEEAMRRSMEQADRAMDIIKRLSLFAKSGIDSEIKFESVKISEVIEDILPLIRYELATHQIALTRDIPPNLPEVRADRRYLEEILFNLLVNASQAIKGAGKPGEIKIAAEIATPSSGLAMTHSQPVIASEARQAAGLERSPRPESGLAMTESSKQIIITISDTGPGIPPDKLEYVFRPFYTTKEEGTGLGLYITQQLVEKIGGKILVCAHPRPGAIFAITLPMRSSVCSN